MQIITLPNGKRVSGAAYIAALARAKAAPDALFRISYDSILGRDFVELVRRGVHDRINQRGGPPPGGRKRDPDYQGALYRAARRLNARGGLYRDDAPELLRRFPERLYD